MSIKYKIYGALRALTGKPFHYVSAVIVAAGNGSRMNSPETKQLMNLDGKPVIINTLLAFELCELIGEIIIVANENELSCYPPLLSLYGITKVKKIIAGGKTRQESVKLGFECISDKADFTAIHDGARPLVTDAIIKSVLQAAFKYRAAAAAAPSNDSVKLASSNNFIEKTIDRSRLWLMQTPQVFYSDLFRASLFTAEKNSFTATDDSSLAENAGFPVKLVNCGYENIKITTPVDLQLAEIIIRRRKESDKK